MPEEGARGLTARVGLRRLDHVAVAVRDLARAWDLFGAVLGGRFITGGDNDATGIRLMHLQLGGFKVELMQPLRSDSMLARALQQRGEGLHHVTFVVDDVEQTVEALPAAGFPLTGTDLTNPVWRETFIKPGVSQGALVQLVDTTRDWSAGVPGVDLTSVLRGQAVLLNAVPCLRRADAIGAPA